jgi:hypothetical protein
MIIYKCIQKFNRDSGKPEMVKVFDHIRCDYTGKEIDDCENMTYANYTLDYGDSDPCFGAGGDEFKFGQDYSIDVHTFLSEQYHFIDGQGSYHQDTCHQMMKEALANHEKQDSPWEYCYSFSSMCRAARILTAKRLIEDKVIEPWQLSSDTEEYT